MVINNLSSATTAQRTFVPGFGTILGNISSREFSKKLRLRRTKNSPEHPEI
jgi:hypothetical protein